MGPLEGDEDEWYFNNYKLLKYYYTAPVSWVLKSRNAPDHVIGKPKWIPIIGHKNRKLFSRFLRRGRSRTIKFAQSLLYNKRCALPVGDSFLKKEMSEYKNNLTKPSSHEDIQFSEKIILSCIPIVFPNCKITLERVSSKGNFCTSSSSAFNGISEPQISLLKKEVPIIHDLPLPSPYFSYGLIPSDVEGKAVLLPEPLKARTICTINHMEFYAGKPIQKLLCSSMKRSEVLLFGREASVIDIEGLVSRSKKFFGNEEPLFFVSGDYKNATGFISPYVSRRMDKLMFQSLGDFDVPVMDDYSPLLKIMGKIWEYIPRDGFQKRHWINLNVWFSEALKTQPQVKMSSVRQTLFLNRKITFPDGDVILQTNEQLMGDIKSFPLLCLLNYSLWYDSCGGHKRCVDDYQTILGKSVEIYDLPPPCLINGDDFLAYAPLSVIEKWMTKVEEYSFVLSIGKTYISSSYGCINSRMFSLKTGLVNKIDTFRLNIPLKKEIRPFDQISRELSLEGVKYYPRLLNLYIKWNREHLDQFSLKGKLNWYLLPSEGGLGLSPMKPFNVTRSQTIIKNLTSRKVLGTNRPFLPSYFLKKISSIPMESLHSGVLNPWDLCLIKGFKDKRAFYSFPKPIVRMLKKLKTCFKGEKFQFLHGLKKAPYFKIKKEGFDFKKVYRDTTILLKPYHTHVSDSGFYNPIETIEKIKIFSDFKIREGLCPPIRCLKKPGFVMRKVLLKK
jgi:hypothetical protein